MAWAIAFLVSTAINVQLFRMIRRSIKHTDEAMRQLRVSIKMVEEYERRQKVLCRQLDRYRQREQQKLGVYR